MQVCMFIMFLANQPNTYVNEKKRKQKNVNFT